MILVTKTSDLSVCARACVVIPFILDVRFADVPAGVIQEECHTGMLHLPSAVLALIFSREGEFFRLRDRFLGV